MDAERFAQGGLIESYDGKSDVPVPWTGGCVISSVVALRLADRPEIRAALERIRGQIDNETG